MTFSTRRVNSVIGSANVTNVGGAASIQAALSDDLTTTYADFAPVYPNVLNIKMNYAALVSGQYALRVRPWIKCKISGGTPFYGLYINVQMTYNGVYMPSEQFFLPSTATTQVIYNGAYVSDPAAISDAGLQNARMIISMSDYGSAHLHVQEAGIDIELDNVPVVGSLAVNYVGSSARPTLTWLFSGPSGLPGPASGQAAYQVVVTTGSVAPSLDPFGYGIVKLEDSGIVYNTGVNDGAGNISNTYKLQNFVDTSTYPSAVIWVRVATKSAGRLQWSEWATVTPFGSFAATEAPKVTTTVDSVNTKVDVAIYDANNRLTMQQAQAINSTQSNTGWQIDTSRGAATLTIPVGTWNITRTAAGAGDCAMILTGPSTNRGWVPVIEGRTYRYCFTALVASTVRSVQKEVTWYDKTGTIIGATATNQESTSGHPSLPTQMGASFTAPTNARFAKLGIAGISMANAEVLILDQISFADGTANISNPQGGFTNTQNKMLHEDSTYENSIGSWVTRVNATFTNADATLTAGIGSKYLLIKPSVAGNVEAETSVFYNCTAGKDYWITVWSGYVNGASISPVAKMFIEFYNSSGQLIEKYGVDCNRVALSAANVKKTKVTAPSTAVKYKFSVTFGSASTTAGFAIDQLSVVCGDFAPFTADNIDVDWRPGHKSTGDLVLGEDAETFVIIERGLSASGPWTEIRGSRTAKMSYFGYLLVNDYEGPPGVSVWYRAKTVSQLPSSDQTSVNTIVGPVTYPAVPVAQTGKWMIRDPQNASGIGTQFIDIIDNGFTPSYPEEQAVFLPLGRTRKMVVRDVIRGAEFNFTADFLTQQAFDDFMTLRNRQVPLLFVQTWTGKSWYISLGGVASTVEANTNPVRRTVAIDAVEVDVP